MLLQRAVGLKDFQSCFNQKKQKTQIISWKHKSQHYINITIVFMFSWRQGRHCLPGKVLPALGPREALAWLATNETHEPLLQSFKG